jgi:cytochrome o ubiquinol oxidase subunit I
MYGRLTAEAFRHDLIEYGAGASMLLGAIIVVAFLTFTKRWKWLWTDWLTSVDHKKIGAMYVIASAIMMFKGIVDAVMMRLQQAIAVGSSMGYLETDHYQQIFTAHGVTMIFFVAMGLVFGIINLVLPLQIGARDVAFPFLNSLSFWLFVSGAMLVMVSLMVGVFAETGWTSYPPLSGIELSPGVGVDYWIWSIQISGVGSLLSGVNFLVTILKMRCPGMTLMKMPVFVWSALATMILVIFAFPILTATLAMLSTDRALGTHLFTSDFGGNPMMYINLFWAWGHPEVYILVLPAFGIFSEVVSVFSKKKLFGYATMVWAIAGITILSFLVWLHHFFTMGAGANVNAFFGIMTMIIAVPTGVKIFNWLFTMYRGKVRFTTPMLWFMGFIIIFTTGGMSGVLLAIPAVDFQVHNSLFLIAHFHSTIIGGVVFGLFAGYSYWFPKFTGFFLNEKLGKIAFWCWFFGFFLAFMPLYVLGLMGAQRRLEHYDIPEWQPLFVIAFIGSLIVMAGLGVQFLQLLVSIRDRKKNRDLTGDPWDGRTLEWSTSSPPPFYNFAVIPEVQDRDPFWVEKQSHAANKREYEDIHMPKNTPYGLYIGILSFLFGFGIIWYLFWLSLVSAVGILVCLVCHVSNRQPEYTILASEVREMEMKREGR